jgi:putative transport protein
MHIASALVGALSGSPILTLFVVIGLGFLLGQISLFGFRFGIAGVLFVGLAVGSLSPLITLPEVVPTLGLVLFVYATGIGTGRAFFDAFRREGYRTNAVAAGTLILGALVAFALGRLLGVPAPVLAGMYCGALTNTPALAAVQERVSERAVEAGLTPEGVKALADMPVLGYSVAYPVGVIGALLCFELVRRLWRVTQEPAHEVPEPRVREFVVRNPGVMGRTIREVVDLNPDAAFVISRIRKEGHVDIARADTLLTEGDVVAVVGDEQALHRAASIFGGASTSHIAMDRSELDYRRVFVSNGEVVGKRIRDLELVDRLSAVITRLRRGDVDIVPDAETRLEYGDRIRVLTRREKFGAVARFFGDSIRGAAEMDFGSLAIGMVLGVLVGMLPIPLGGGRTLHLGVAGGTLLVALVLGRVERSGGISWLMPVPANLTMRQIGLLLFLAGIGIRAGYTFADSLRHNGPQLLLAAAGVTFVVTLATLVIGRHLLGLRFDALLGMASGVQTQPACLAYADAFARSDVPSVSYAAVFPTAMMVKILLAQLLLT